MTKSRQRLALVALLLLAQLAAITVIVGSLQRKTQDRIELNARGTLSQLGDDVEDKIHQFLSPAEVAIRLSQSLIYEGGILSDSDDDLERYFKNAVLANRNLKGLYLGRDDGSFVYVSREGPVLTIKRIQIENGSRTVTVSQHNLRTQKTDRDTNVEDDFEPRSRPWYIQARESKKLIWTDTYSFFTSKMPGITAAVAVKDNQGQDAGVLGVDIDIKELSEFISSIPNTRNGSAIIIDENHSVVAYSDVRSFVSNVQASEIPNFGDVASLPLQRLFNNVSSLGNPFQSLLGGFSQIEVDGQAQLALARPMSLSGGETRWLLLAIAPADDFAGSLQQLFNNNLWLLLGIILLPGILILLLIRQVAKAEPDGHG